MKIFPLLDVRFELDADALHELGPVYSAAQLHALERSSGDNRFILEATYGELLESAGDRRSLSLWLRVILDPDFGHRFTSANLKVSFEPDSFAVRKLYPEEILEPCECSALRESDGFSVHCDGEVAGALFPLRYSSRVQGSGVKLPMALWKFREIEEGEGIPFQIPIYLLVDCPQDPRVDAKISATATVEDLDTAEVVQLQLTASLSDLLGKVDTRAQTHRESSPPMLSDPAEVREVQEPKTEARSGMNFELLVRAEQTRGVWRLSYELFAEENGSRVRRGTHAPVCLGDDPEKYFSDVFRQLGGLAGKDYGTRRVTDRLEAIGEILRHRLIPESLSTALREMSEHGGHLLIRSMEPWVPWELVKLDRDKKARDDLGPFLADAFTVARWLPDAPLVKHLPVSRMALVVSRDSARVSLAGEGKDVMALVDPPGRLVADITPRYSKVLDALGSGIYDGFHFAGHGVAGRGNADDSAISLGSVGRLTPLDLHGRARRFKEGRPLVFLNSCESSQGGVVLGVSGGWASTFVELGAGAFLGPLWKVTDGEARDFALGFYKHFLAGVPIAEAVRRTRRELFQRYGGHPVWLAYALFAHPGAVCSGAMPTS